ncbi:NADP oxidoreductase [Streptomyces sp. 150FB]|uniref:NADPH-dependent F420 reductase n=1 Tax=Streptomyces sp. 150FB TaxID=1576605 RepID=UPI00058947F6|nr:NAD(P)-binding domain-containing protein [Streptomyces sp. 150FB]KIF73747.1 NADP oxidoreductase [Streptomyces sp. 150FB]
MRIGIIGTGIMARGLGAHWARAGHELLIGGRSAAKAQDLARTLGARSGTPEEAALFGEATLLAVPYDAVAGVLASAGAGEGALRGRVLIDCTNAVGPGFLLTTGPGPGAARRIAAATGGRVVKAFSHVTGSLWQLPATGPTEAPHGSDAPHGSRAPEFPEGPLAVPLCGDDEAALDLVRTLVRDTGRVPLDGGGLERADQLEAATAFLIGLWKTGQDPRAMLPPYEAATA